MQWSDAGFILSARKHGESSAIVNILTRHHGRHAGLVRGGAGRRLRGILQPGNAVAAYWRARLAEHLGSFTVELAGAHAAPLLGDPDRLAALASACAVAESLLPEREVHAAVYEGFRVLLAALDSSPQWQAVYVRWELGLLAELGFGLDLTRCAVTGTAQDLVYVSPRSGRAVSAAAGEPYRDRLLALPAFLLSAGNGDHPGPEAVRDGLLLTGYFLASHASAAHHRGLPPARRRFADRFRGGTISSI